MMPSVTVFKKKKKRITLSRDVMAGAVAAMLDMEMRTRYQQLQSSECSRESLGPCKWWNCLWTSFT